MTEVTVVFTTETEYDDDAWGRLIEESLRLDYGIEADVIETTQEDA
jgi:hypothetical protein